MLCSFCHKRLYYREEQEISNPPIEILGHYVFGDKTICVECWDNNYTKMDHPNQKRQTKETTTPKPL